ncbi:hypothetical protein [Desulfovibrio litoralis]|uniref:PilZ domain-containing protein n=1 Tax=Desulfovibrio litoralis DSM 11393 TaxID=1121455 RepID=A0A1M7S9K2_9BACT|nr:hypothetical protein [Desulfovibrio litoralis]SHN55054.1 hypothetical protein SAMN02745728_00624 [Desulfovibrio litoralis DSM 11393]
MLEHLFIPLNQLKSTESVYALVKKTFEERSVSYANLGDIFFILLGVIAIALLGMAIIAYRNSRKKYIPYDWIINPSELNKIFNDSIDQRARYEITFPVEENGTRRPGIVTALSSVGSGVLNFDCADIENLSSSWLGRDAELYFKVKNENKKYVFYSFRSVIDGIRKLRDSTWMLSFRIPSHLETKQKRNFLRITPSVEHVMGLAIWQTDPITGALPSDIKLCGRPVLALVPGRVNQVELKDISAGGGRITVRKEDAENSSLEFNIGERLVLLLDLLEPEQNTRLRLLFHCKVQNPFIDFAKQHIEVGIQFIEWGKIKEATSSEIEWFKIAKLGEVEPLGNWIMRRHLESYRENSLVDDE